METAQAIELARHTLIAALMMAAPLLAAVLLTALLLAVIQTVLNLQEQALTVVPKLVLTALMVVALAPWMLRRLIEFTVPLLRDALSQRI